MVSDPLLLVYNMYAYIHGDSFERPLIRVVVSLADVLRWPSCFHSAPTYESSDLNKLPPLLECPICTTTSRQCFRLSVCVFLCSDDNDTKCSKLLRASLSGKSGWIVMWRGNCRSQCRRKTVGTFKSRLRTAVPIPNAIKSSVLFCRVSWHMWLGQNRL